MASGRYYVATGELVVFAAVDHSANERVVYETSGYSGHAGCRNNPECVEERGEGPIPPGDYIAWYRPSHPGLGPDVFYLEPCQPLPNGRSGFFIHGDSHDHPGDASHGCIVLPRSSRIALHEFQLQRLEVVLRP